MTGDGLPDPAGTYSPVGWFCGERYYTSPTTNFYIYYGTLAVAWMIATALTDPQPANCFANATMEGQYTPVGTYTGNPVVTEQ